MIKTSTYHHSVKASLESLFLGKNSDLLIEALRVSEAPLTGNHIGVELLIPHASWRHHNIVARGLLTEVFEQVLKPRLLEVFGNVPISMLPSTLLEGADVSIAWGRSFTRSGRYSLFFQDQFLLSYQNETLIDDGIFVHHGFLGISRFSLIVNKTTFNLFLNDGEYTLSGKNLTSKDGVFNFEIEVRDSSV